MNNKKILLITPFFAPETHAAVFRVHKLAKYLHRENWEVHVLTVTTNYTYNEDENLIKELEGVTIHRARYIEPSFRGLKMAVGGKDRTFKSMKQQNNANISLNNVSSKSKESSLVNKLYNYLLNNHLKNPDRFWTWENSAIKLGKQIILKESIGTIYTTCLPFTTNKIGIALKKQTNVKWVADFRDPITYAKRMYSDNNRIFLRQKQIQDLTFKYADQITGLSSSYGLIFNDQYEGKYGYKFTFIPTGLDDDYLPKRVVEKENTLLFIGEYLKEYEDKFFKLFKTAIEGLEMQQVPKIIIIGRIEVNKKIVTPYIKKLGIEKLVLFYDHMPQNKLYEFIEKSRFVLLISGRTALWWTNFAKLVDYIALKKEVIAIVPDISEARSELNKANAGVFLNYDKSSINKLREIFSNNIHVKNVNEIYCKRYLASTQVKSFIKVFESL